MIPHDFETHQSAWRAALVRCANDARGDDKSYWHHEIRAFDNAYAELFAQKKRYGIDRVMDRQLSNPMPKMDEDLNAIFTKADPLDPAGMVWPLGQKPAIYLDNESLVATGFECFVRTFRYSDNQGLHDRAQECRNEILRRININAMRSGVKDEEVAYCVTGLQALAKKVSKKDLPVVSAAQKLLHRILTVEDRDRYWFEPYELLRKWHTLLQKIGSAAGLMSGDDIGEKILPKIHELVEKEKA